MKLNKWFRQIHRLLSIAFIVGVAVYVIAMTQGRPAPWLGVFPLVPLFSLLITGVYLFVLPYATRRRSGRPVVE